MNNQWCRRDFQFCFYELLWKTRSTCKNRWNSKSTRESEQIFGSSSSLTNPENSLNGGTYRFTVFTNKMQFMNLTLRNFPSVVSLESSEKSLFASEQFWKIHYKLNRLWANRDTKNFWLFKTAISFLSFELSCT